MTLTSDKDLRRLLKEAEKIGWTFFKGKRHIKGRHADGVRTTTIAVSPSDHHVLRITMRDLGML